MLKQILSTDDDVRSLIARVFLGIVILPHGLQKLLGMFGGHGFQGTMDFFVNMAGVPAPIAVLIILGESFGALFLIFGLISRVSAAGIALIMLGAMAMIHIPNGFFMNWFGTQVGEGFEYHLLALGLAIIVIIKGGGMYSVDGSL